MTNRRNFLKSIALLGTAATLPSTNLFAESILAPKPIGDGLTVVRHSAEINRKKDPPRVITIPDVGEFKVLKGDFHMHTYFSDGKVMPQDRVHEAIDNGLDVIAITDHIESENRELRYRANRNRSYDLAKVEADKNNLILVRGGEITKPAWHFNAIFLQDVNALAAVKDDWRKMLAVSVEQGGFNFWNHPSWIDRTPDTPPFGLKSGEPMRFHAEIEEDRKNGLIHGIEVFNGVSHFPIALDWCKERNLIPVTVTDIHQSDWNTYGHQNPLRPMSLILAKDRSYESVKEAFFAGRIVGWAANMVLGLSPWVEQLFRSCVAIQKTNSGVSLKNLSDIPCLIEANGKSAEIAAKETLSIAATKSFTVSNWFVGTNKSLEVTVG